MTIRAKIILLSIPPILMLFYFVQQEIREGLTSKNNLKDVYAKILKAEKVSNIVHELQKERGLSSLYLTNRGKETGDKFQEQARETDKRIEELGTFLKQSKGDLQILSLFSGLTATRNQIHSFDITPFETEDFYTSTIAELLEEIIEIAKMARLHETKNVLFAHSHLLNAKEYLGQIRANLGAVFTAGAFDTYRQERLVTLRRAYERNSRNFVQETTDDIKDYYHQTFRGPAVQSTMDMIDTALERSGERTIGIDPAVWFESATSSINLLKKVEDYSIVKIKQNTTRDLDNAIRQININIGLTLILLIIASALSIVLCKTIIGRLEHLQERMTSIVQTRDFSRSVAVQSNDEIGGITKAFNALLETARTSIADIERLSATDSLTQIYNRLKFNDLFKLELQRVQRYKTSLSLIIFDIDRFKEINDAHGHLAGDTVLVELAMIVRESLRGTDIFARWGGEEFVILATETSIEGAKKLAEKVRSEIERFHFTTVVNVTCSFGVAEYTEGDNIDTLSKRADDALYDAKRSGRNRVCAR